MASSCSAPPYALGMAFTLIKNSWLKSISETTFVREPISIPKKALTGNRFSSWIITTFLLRMWNVIMAYPKPAHQSNPRVISIHQVEIPCWWLELGMQHLCYRSQCAVRAAGFQGNHNKVSQEEHGSDHSYGSRVNHYSIWDIQYKATCYI